MKKLKHNVIFVGSLGLILALIMISRWASKKEKHHDPDNSSVEFVEKIQAPETLAESEPDLGIPPDGVSKENWDRVIARHESGRSTNTSVSFYGKVVDQNLVPIEGAKIVLRLSTYNEDLQEVLKGWESAMLKHTAISLESDVDGLFFVNELVGRTLLVESIEKVGYRPAREGRSSLGSFGYGPNYTNPHFASKDSPVSFFLWKTGETEPMIKAQMRLWISMKPGEQANSLFFLTGRSIYGEDPSGDLVVSVNNRSKKQTGKFDWSIKLSPLEGGIMETDDAFLYRAPESGYLDEYEFEMLAEDPKWQSGVYDKKFYLRSGSNGIFASAIATLLAFPDGRGRVILDLLINPSGSRNLEYDPAKDITAKYHDPRKR